MINSVALAIPVLREEGLKDLSSWLLAEKFAGQIKLLPAEAGRFDGGLEDRHYFSLLERKNRHASIG